MNSDTSIVSGKVSIDFSGSGRLDAQDTKIAQITIKIATHDRLPTVIPPFSSNNK